MIGITSRNYASSYIFCQLDPSISDYFYTILLEGAWSKKKQMLFIGCTLINFESMAFDTKNK